jgi:hypothetical protein
MTIATYAVTTATGNAYTSSGNTAITSLTLCNWGASNVTVNLYVVPNGSSPSTSNLMYDVLPLTTGDTYQIYQAAEKLLLGPNDMIQVNASANSVTAITSYTSI